MVRECLVDGPRGRAGVPPEHDAEWVLDEVDSLRHVLRSEHASHWAHRVDEGRQRVESGSWDYLGHTLELLRLYGPKWLDRDRLEAVIVAVGTLW